MINNAFQLDIKHYRFPEVDEKNMLKFSKTSYSVKNNILFSRPSNENIDDRPIAGPRYIKISELPLNKKIKQPIIDINYNSFKLPFLSPLEVNEYYKPKPIHFAIAIIFHLFFLSFYFITSYFVSLDQQTPEIVEVTFGLNETAAQTYQKTKELDEGETEASKTIRELPQLTKNITPDTSPAIEEQAPIINNENTLTFKEQENKTKPIEKKENKDKVEPNKPIGPAPDKDKQKVKLDDYLKRKEMDTRKESNIKTDGIHEKNLVKPEGSKVNPNKIPTSPFSSPSDLPDSPFAEAPSGVLDGKISNKSYNSYKAYIGRQLKLNWSTSEGNNFPTNLKAKVEFTINPYGHLVGKPKIIRSSGSHEFDQLVLNSLESTFPVSDPPPKDINPPKKFEAYYSAKNVQ
jgi:outer membrane biosynthesis protein TonB